MNHFRNIFWLGIKELQSFLRDVALLALVIYTFTFAIYIQGHSNVQELHNASVGIVDQDHSALSRRIAAALLPPEFKAPMEILASDADHLMNIAAYTFIIVIPPSFERNVLADRVPVVQVNVDATAMVAAGLGYGYLQQILTSEISNFVSRNEGQFLSRAQNVAKSDITLAVRIAFNPNVTTAWFTGVMGIVNNVTMLAIILAGAAIIREREHGTMDHLLSMPVQPFEIAMSKIWANGLVITTAVIVSLELIVRQALEIPIAGSVPLFVAGVISYLFFASAIGIFLATLARSMPQLGLLYILVAMPMNILSGSNTPLESMPPALSTIMMFSPSTHFVLFAQSILFRGAGFSVVWPQFLYILFVGALILWMALRRFRSVAVQTG